MKFGLYLLVIESFLKPNQEILLHFEYGWGNGYVLLPPNHPFHGKQYENLSINIHGGLTYGEFFKSDQFINWIGYREFYGDINMDNYQKFQNYWIIGFDTAHCDDNLLTCSKEFVINETNDLLEQCLGDDIEGIKKYKSVYLRKDKLKNIEKMHQ